MSGQVYQEEAVAYVRVRTVDPREGSVRSCPKCPHEDGERLWDPSSVSTYSSAGGGRVSLGYTVVVVSALFLLSCWSWRWW